MDVKFSLILQSMKSDPALSTKDVAEKNDISKLTNKKFLTRKIQSTHQICFGFSLKYTSISSTKTPIIA